MTASGITSKIVLLGSSYVGKTSIIIKALTGVYNDNLTPTLGANYSTKNVQIGKTDMRLQIWDTAGEEKYRSLVPMFFRGAEGAILVFSIDNKNSFEDLSFFVKSLDESTSPDLVKIVVGNKIDLEADNLREVATLDAEKFAESVQAHYIEVSAKTGQRVEELFLLIAKSLLEMRTDRKGFDEAQLSIETDSQSSCC